MEDLNGIDPVAFNNIFIERLDTAEGLQKSASTGAAFVRSKIREIGFARRVLPPENITRAECTRAVDHDTLVKIVDIEHDSKAMAVNFASEADERYISGKRYALPFFKVESEKFVKTEGELMAYRGKLCKRHPKSGRLQVRGIRGICNLSNREASCFSSYRCKQKRINFSSEHDRLRRVTIKHCSYEHC